MVKSGVAKITAFFGRYDPVTFKKGELIAAGGTTPKGVYLLKRGVVRMYMYTEHGDELTLHFFRPGSFFPLAWALNNTENRFYFSALTSVKTQLSPREEVVRFIRGDADVAFDLSRRLLSGIEGLLTRVESLSADGAEGRTLGMIKFLGKHFGVKNGKLQALAIPVTHQDLANLTGLTRETTTRQIDRLQREGKIRVSDHLISWRSL